MKLGESIRISWRAITGHKLRSGLTTLGVIIGVGAVIVFMVLGGGFEENLVEDFREDEAPVMQVVTQTEPEGGFGIRFVDAPIYTERDVERLSGLEGVDYVAPDGSISAAQLRYGDGQSAGGSVGTFSITATNPDAFQGDAWEIVQGSAFSSEDEAVVNEALVTLLGGDIGVGDEITVRFEDGREPTFTVSGIVDDETGGFTAPNIYVPVDPYYTLTIVGPDGTEQRAYGTLTVAAGSVTELEAVQDRVQAYFQEESDARRLTEDNQEIVVRTTEDFVDQVTDIIDQFALFLGGIAAISLVVGSIGIANIMIVSVTERTREIGIMKAVGARKRDIVQLFLVESVILGVIGAALGVVVGLGAGYLGVTYFGWPMAYPIEWILIAVAVGLGVGILSGLYPAWRAARVDPIEALRRE